MNESLNTTAAVFLARLNEKMANSRNLDWRKGRMRVVNYLLEAFPGKGLQPSRADAEAFAARYADANEAVRQKWFPDQETLFKPSFSNYPDRADQDSISDTELFEISASVIENLAADYSKLWHEYDDVRKDADDDESFE